MFYKDFLKEKPFKATTNGDDEGFVTAGLVTIQTWGADYYSWRLLLRLCLAL